MSATRVLFFLAGVDHDKLMPGSQERYDEKLRRSLMQNLLRGRAASRNMKLKTADARGALLQEKKIQRGLFFRVHHGDPAPCTIPGFRARMSHPSQQFNLWIQRCSRCVALGLGQDAQEFAMAPVSDSCVCLAPGGGFRGLMWLHVDDMLMAVDEIHRMKQI